MTNLRTFIAAISACLLAVSCTENGPPKSSLNDKAIVPEGISLTQVSPGVVNVSDPGNVTVRQAVGAPNGASVVAPEPNLPKEAVVVPPKDAKWTIVCTVVGGPGHSQRARQFKEQLIAATKSDKWYVVHEDDKSTIYHGFYRTIDRGSKDGDLAQAERFKIASMKNAAGEMPMQLCTFMQLDRAGPEAPSDWDLGNYTRNPRQFWSLQIAAYTADASDGEGHDRKWAAVESVKSMRAQGIPAYFSHGETVSSVCIGIWPEEAIKKQTGGNEKGNAGGDNAEQSIFVSTAPLPAGITPKDAEGRPMKTVVPRVEILDPELYSWARKFPSHMINSEERMHEVMNTRTGQKEQVAEPSILVLLPEQKQAAITSNTPRTAAPNTSTLQALPPALLQIDTPQPGVRKLREIGQ